MSMKSFALMNKTTGLTGKDAMEFMGKIGEE